MRLQGARTAEKDQGSGLDATAEAEAAAGGVADD